jgi:hypothetical protein
MSRKHCETSRNVLLSFYLFQAPGKQLGDAWGHQKVSRKVWGALRKLWKNPKKILFFVFLISHFRKISPKENAQQLQHKIIMKKEIQNFAAIISTYLTSKKVHTNHFSMANMPKIFEEKYLKCFAC